MQRVPSAREKARAKSNAAEQEDLGIDYWKGGKKFRETRNGSGRNDRLNHDKGRILQLVQAGFEKTTDWGIERRRE